MTHALINPADPPERQRQKLLQIVDVLMRRVEQATDDGGRAYLQFERAAMLEDQVRERTGELERALGLLNQTNARLAEATAEAEAARQNLASAIETVQEGFALFDADDRMVMCNSRFSRQLADIRDGLGPGLSFADYVRMVSLSRDLALPPGESADGWAQARMRRHQDRHVMFNVQLSGDRWIQVSEHRTQDGGTVILQTDVTDIIRLERQERGKLLDDQARMIRATLEHISQGVGIFDAEARLVGWNHRLATLLTVPAGRFRLGAPIDTLTEALGRQFALNGNMTPATIAHWARGPRPRPALDFELDRGADLVLAVFAEEMPDGGFVMSFSDITAERRALHALAEANETLERRVADRTAELAEALGRAEQANAARARFVAAASHDLLQPLSAAKLFVASLSDSGLADDARATLGKVENALTSVEGILDALLDISKLESGRASVDVIPVALGPILDQLADEFAPLAEAKGLRLTVRPAAVTVASDPTYLRRILQNLIGNAVRYTARGRILVGGRRTGAALRIDVIDTGPGIPESEQANVFREFHRLNARASASEGMGLGLAIVERAAALLDHPLTLRSVPGRGTRFSLLLPLLASGAAEPAALAAPLTETAEMSRHEGRIVCLVENDPDLRRALCQLLEKWRLEVIDVSSGEEALALLDEIGIVPDRFLIDQELGAGLDGLSLVGQLRARHGAIAARLLTASRAPALDAACAASDVTVLRKPVDAAVLAAFLLR
ncbi:PAS-domain containing protein [Albidovulum sp.]|uniref:sensor histidine kinase n=1 Tax=Albidovulum sp. TaxID=1872424 RepID=UPI001DFB7210|nr:PAS-domain containing protein [Paracoccaceae bacterium]MCC0047368.1 PAS-domain containing protein [Defluviimonas sp.]HPE24311.1 PAS-domain containing protein [Albidovulum sp.]MCB2142180.1 PAS-domain containing protein [Paracoccaceae bacterium]MCB2151528.1 PAS-domain containing protein [Paracoccaceae bacterium]